MFEIPLFPLNNVLFPTITTNLNIFEPRYKQMIGECLQNNQTFGWVLIKEGSEVGDPFVQPHQVGCIAHIQRINPNNNGQLFISVHGKDRFRILEVDTSRSYLTATVEPFILPEYDVEILKPYKKPLEALLVEYNKLTKSNMPLFTRLGFMTPDPLHLAYKAADTLQSQRLIEKQHLLEAETAQDFIERTYAALQFEVKLLTLMKERNDSQNKKENEPFSLN
jgi:Lon protease-like protein